MNDRRLAVRPLSEAHEVEELPLRVVPDWLEQVRCATTLCRLIDRHLDYEAECRRLRTPEEFRPRELCPEQRVQMVSDLAAVTR